MEQGLARDAAFVVIGAADVGALDDRQYREAQLAAGLVEGRLHLLAHALGASACGMTFIDGEVPALLGEPLDGLLLTLRRSAGVPVDARWPARRADRRPQRRSACIGSARGEPTTEREMGTGSAPT
jgi:nitroreductase